MGDISYRKENKLRFPRFTGDLSGVQQHLPVPDTGEIMLNFEILRTRVLRQYGLQRTKSWNIPLLVTRHKNRTPTFSLGYTTELI